MNNSGWRFSSPWLNESQLVCNFPADEYADDAAEVADKKLPEQTKADFFSEPPADPAANEHTDPDEEFTHAGEST